MACTLDSNALTKRLTTLLGMLACGDLDEHEIGRIVDVCVQAQKQPAQTLRENYGADAAKVAEYDPDGVSAFIVFVELEDYFAVADTVEDLYEQVRSEEHTSELQSLMRISYAVFCLKKKK